MIKGKAPVVEELALGSVETPLGTVWVATSEAGVRVVTVPAASEGDCLAIASSKGRAICRQDLPSDQLAQVLDELRRYFAGMLRVFTTPLDLRGTPFQRRVWAAVAAVPYGETVTYREIAERIGAPNAYRAVGAANGANPAAIIVPCHRIIGSEGKLHGYGGGLHQKRALLDLEAAHASDAARA
ncbi:MAG TPA: methylated-DNA--[protein]-cysteine S-methyltransferase [Nitrolancea sp.]